MNSLPMTADMLIQLVVCSITATIHLFMGLYGFTIRRQKTPDQQLFLLLSIGLAWYSFTSGLSHTLGRFYPETLALSPLLSGYLFPGFYLYCKSVIHPLQKRHYWLLSFGLLGSIYSLYVMSSAEHLLYLQNYIFNDQGRTR